MVFATKAVMLARLRRFAQLDWETRLDRVVGLDGIERAQPGDAITASLKLCAADAGGGFKGTSSARARG
ncbi:MAG: hypothetical protein AB1563_07755, partial [Bacillota bacterium]